MFRDRFSIINVAGGNGSPSTVTGIAIRSYISYVEASATEAQIYYSPLRARRDCPDVYWLEAVHLLRTVHSGPG